jgi:hypothetical protein
MIYCHTKDTRLDHFPKPPATSDEKRRRGNGTGVTRDPHTTPDRNTFASRKVMSKTLSAMLAAIAGSRPDSNDT